MEQRSALLARPLPHARGRRPERILVIHRARGVELVGERRNHVARTRLVQHAGHVALDERRPFPDTIAEEPGVTQRLAASELEAIFDYAYFTREVDKSFARMGLIKG